MPFLMPNFTVSAIGFLLEHQYRQVNICVSLPAH